MVWVVVWPMGGPIELASEPSVVIVIHEVQRGSATGHVVVYAMAHSVYPVIHVAQEGWGG